jgi:hypothetical protein
MRRSMIVAPPPLAGSSCAISAVHCREVEYRPIRGIRLTLDFDTDFLYA